MSEIKVVQIKVLSDPTLHLEFDLTSGVLTEILVKYNHNYDYREDIVLDNIEQYILSRQVRENITNGLQSFLKSLREINFGNQLSVGDSVTFSEAIHREPYKSFFETLGREHSTLARVEAIDEYGDISISVMELFWHGDRWNHVKPDFENNENCYLPRKMFRLAQKVSLYVDGENVAELSDLIIEHQTARRDEI